MITKVFVTSDLTATISCPNCGKSKKQDVSKFIKDDAQVSLKCKCKCNHAFSLILDRRRSIRKDKFFDGNIIGLNIKGYILRESSKSKIMVKNLSMHGIRITTQEKIPLEEGEKIEIEFQLDDPKKSKILREIIVKRILSPVDIVCEFSSNDHYGYLYKYFQSHF